MWIFAFLASFSAYALILTVVRNFRYESYITQLKTSGELSFKGQQEHQILKKAGYDIHYFASGSKENDLLVFLPAAFCDHRMFDNQVEYFSGKFRVITIDLIGHGLSQVKDSNDKMDAAAGHLLEIMELEGYQNAHFVGVSMGTLIAQHFAYLYPEKVASMTVVGGYDIHKDNKDIVRAQLTEKLKWPLKILFSMNSFRRYVAGTSSVKPHEQAKIYEIAKGFRRNSFKVMQGLTKLENLDQPGGRTYPLMLMVGEHDLTISINYARKWHQEDQETSFHLLKDAGHNANMDNPEEFNLVLEKFLMNQKY